MIMAVSRNITPAAPRLNTDPQGSGGVDVEADAA
jgi:hypothetical protein